ncbi:hypothetical protein LCGC14_0451090 [marine sediment metagenome]|uniref:Uncharacterized protein n=1 Tax=marine sediment metagenome TaxID=412755 RepID=A0A0F9VRT2_9ZZZZ
MIVQTDLESSEIAVLKTAVELLTAAGYTLTARLLRNVLLKMGLNV